MLYSSEFYNVAEQLINAGRIIDSKGWVPATSGNFSARLQDGNIAITISSRHKGRLQIDDIMLIDADANSLDGKRSSAETALHTHLYRHYDQARCILHPHSLNAVLIAKLYPQGLKLANYELLKAFSGITTHESQIFIPVVANDQNIPRLAAAVDDILARHSPCYGYIIENHGLYSWGSSVEETLHHLEALDYLFECEIKMFGVNVT